MAIGPGVERVDLSCKCGGRIAGYFPAATATEVRDKWNALHSGPEHSQITVAVWADILAKTGDLMPGDVEIAFPIKVGTDLDEGQVVTA